METVVAKKKIGRNDPCPCGSGKKYKKCCLDKRSPSLNQGQRRQVWESIRRELPPEPHLNVVKSVIWNGYRWRVIRNRLYFRPPEETFHEFIIRVLMWTFNQKWRNRQMSLPDGKRHVVLGWLQSYEEWRIANQREECKEGNAWGAIPTGEVMALHQLGYDIYCLEVSRRMRRFLRNRLRNRGQFQGARYEVAITSILARAGFDVTLLDDTEKSKKHCEFIAEYRGTREKVAVEVKSRHRRGVLHEEGCFDPKEDIKGDVQNLLLKALDQKPKHLAYVVFIDLNLPPTPHLPGEEKPWFKDIKTIADRCIIPSRFNALILTNFAYYYAGNEEPAPPAEYLLITPDFPEVAIKSDQILREVDRSLTRYAYIPREL